MRNDIAALGSNTGSSATTLPKWAVQLLTYCPDAGKGVHNWLFVTALKLHRLHLDDAAIVSLLADATQSCGRDVNESEIQDAVRNSKQSSGGNSSVLKPSRQRVVPNPKSIQSVLDKRRTVAELQALSLVICNPGTPHTEEVIDAFFPDNPLICAGQTNTWTRTQTREEWRGKLSQQQFIVPNSMSAVWGITKTGKKSMRTLTNVGARRFVVVEFDSGNLDEQATILLHLATIAPLVLVVHSGGKSLHGWFFRGAADDATFKKFFDYAVSLGADAATWAASQLVRMPDGVRENGQRQRIVFCNPEPLEVK